MNKFYLQRGVLFYLFSILYFGNRFMSPNSNVRGGGTFDTNYR